MRHASVNADIYWGVGGEASRFALFEMILFHYISLIEHDPFSLYLSDPILHGSHTTTILCVCPMSATTTTHVFQVLLFL